VAAIPAFSLGSDLQRPVTKLASALGTPYRLLTLAPKSGGHPGNAVAISPAIILTTIAAFEGFAEDFLATVLAIQGYGLAQIAQEVGKWNNPTVKELDNAASKLISPEARATLAAGPAQKIIVNHQTAQGNWSARGKIWADILDDSEAWMQVRHLLAHGLATGWRAEVWPLPLKKNTKPAASVLRPKAAGKASLERSCATSCARIYSLGAKHIADTVASDLGVALDWSELPRFV